MNGTATVFGLATLCGPKIEAPKTAFFQGVSIMNFVFRMSRRAASHFSFIFLGICLGLLTWGAPSLAAPRSQQDLQAIFDDLTKTAVGYGAIPSINRTTYMTIHDAELTMDRREAVFVVFFPDGPRIYPQKIMVWHEVLNEFINGKSYCVTYAPISGCLAVYKTDVEGMQLVFDTEGRLYNCNSVLVDRNTGSLWMQLLGMAFDGPLAGKGLAYVPVWWTTWEYARNAYPNAQVLAPPRSTRKAYGRDPYGSYITPGNYYDNEQIPYHVTHMDNRLPAKNRILGLEYENLMLAVDETYVRQKKVVNFFLGPTPMLAVLDPRLNVVRVFDRTVWDSPVLFTEENGRLVDVDTRSTWSYDGTALSGKLKDARLDEFFGMYAFWFAWAAFHPETLLVPGPSVVPDSALVKGVQPTP